MRVLTVNAGSSSLKLRVLDGPKLVADTHLEQWTGEVEPVRDMLDEHRVDAVGHRVVHGGHRLVNATIVNDEVMRYLESLSPLAPLHQPRALAAIRAALQAVIAGTPSVACVDTAFHASLPEYASTYALPMAWNREWSLRRFGFHGLSHAYAVRRAAEIAGVEPQVGRVLSCHLGSGGSLAAVHDGRSVDTTMGFTPDEGLVMATRAGTVDPGLLGWLLTTGRMSVEELFEGLRRRSGLAGLSGVSGDVREVLRARDQGDQEAALAFEVYRHSVTKHAGAMVAALGGLDMLVFTGGVGQHHTAVRAALCRDLEFVGVQVDSARNSEANADADLTGEGSRVRVVVVESREDVEIARQTEEAVRGS